MKAMLFVPVLVAILTMIGVIPSNVYASESDAKRSSDGFNDGSQAAQSDKQSGNQFNPACDPNGLHTSDGQHTTLYCNGWAQGYTSTWNSNNVVPSPNPQQTGTDWNSICNKISFALVSSCDTLVNSDNTLTTAGAHARDCIQNGALLAGGALLLGTPPTTIVSALPIAAQLFGCGDVVDFSKLSLGQLQGLGSIFR
jgi:hypothetical protein